MATVLPSAFIQQSAALTFDMRGPSWLDARGVPVFTYYEEPGNSSHALLVRASFLREFLATHKLELVFQYWLHRMRLSDDYGDEHPEIQSSIDARLAPNLEMQVGKPRRTERDLK